MSPSTLIEVLIISKILSIPATNAIPSTGIPTPCSTIASMIIPAPGTPAVPTDASTVVKTMVSCCPKLISSPYTFAINSAQTPWYIAVPSMFMVAPSGSTKDAIGFDTPSSFSHVSSEIGNVPADDDVVNATAHGENAFLKKMPTGSFASNAMDDPYTKNACKKHPRYTIPTTFISGSSTCGPFAATTGTISPNTPYGASFMIPFVM